MRSDGHKWKPGTGWDFCLVFALALAACAPSGTRRSDELLSRAIEARGGEIVTRVAALSWTGTARVHAGDRTIDIAVSTRVIPFVSAHSESWPISEGPAAKRTLMIDGNGGWSERNGGREPLPPAMTTHERQQYALYGLMLLAPLRDPSATVIADESGRCLSAGHPKAPPTLLCFNEGGALVSASNRVADPEGSAEEIAQVIRFSGEIEDQGVRWPRVMAIEQNGSPHFELSLKEFSVELRP